MEVIAKVLQHRSRFSATSCIGGDGVAYVAVYDTVSYVFTMHAVIRWYRQIWRRTSRWWLQMCTTVRFRFQQQSCSQS
jgi:hypothetical protein